MTPETHTDFVLQVAIAALLVAATLIQAWL